MRTIQLAAFALPLAALASSCAPVDSTPKPLTDQQAERLNKALAGKVAGTPVRCISDFNATDTTRISDDILLYRVSGKLVYKNNLRHSCPGLARDSDILVMEQFGSQKCRGDQIKLVDRISGIPGPVCSLGEFVPYRSSDSAS